MTKPKKKKHPSKGRLKNSNSQGSREKNLAIQSGSSLPIPGTRDVLSGHQWDATSLAELVRLLGEARMFLSKSRLSPSGAAEIELGFHVIEQQALQTKPNLRLIRSRLEGIAEILQGESGTGSSTQKLLQATRGIATLMGGSL